MMLGHFSFLYVSYALIETAGEQLEIRTFLPFSFVLYSYSGGSEELSDDITQQQLLPGVKYVKSHPPASIDSPSICR